MSPAQPDGAPLPGAADLPAQVRADTGGETGRGRPFSVYLHVPYCRVRCGYCDFNTYTNLSMGGGASAGDYVDTLAGELRLAHTAMERVGLPQRAARTVFVGGGTPTMLPAGDLARMLTLVRDTCGLADGAEVTTEANPETVDERYLAALAQAGFTRVSFGMQSAVPQVLRILDRAHTPERVLQVVSWARRAGLATSLDLIYGTPGESLDDWRRSLEAAVEIGPDHLSAYALVIEEGTRMWSQVRRGELPLPTDDDEAAKYELADAVLGRAGYAWYEISNWARPGHECVHNQAYWRDWDWWGAGPGAHSHLGDVRMWNAKHPVAWAGQVTAGRLPVAGHEVVDADSRELERVMLGIRMREGLELRSLTRPGEAATASGTPRRLVPVVGGFVAQGLLEGAAAMAGRAVLTLRGRLMADTVTRELVD
ncbi:radical SAM family heme chaperone HemW [Actinomyces succiniciruminis]|uniref:Heme chaperone HemW n=1 Tax=Actinomyces succiniciruminis TaxID=1522002 RepID=A0A1L7RNV6_9ACTO|nr:radical SAM family heme chaperone HemW [Actinomyces succiniciruminis]CED91900.1 Oxygen-independent coproporphyrinogen-III oxidase-like protein sll1917 [Actinomyces succiniciruminis]